MRERPAHRSAGNGDLRAHEETEVGAGVSAEVTVTAPSRRMEKKTTATQLMQWQDD
jgi:hypothetical protein